MSGVVRWAEKWLKTKISEIKEIYFSKSLGNRKKMSYFAS